MLERCDLEFLEDLASRIGTSPRNHWIHEKRKLISILSQKLDSVEAGMVFKSYLLCLNPQKIVEKLAPRQLRELTNAVKRFLACDKYLQEVIVGRLRCDLVGIRGADILAIEIKSARDKIKNALQQVKYYQLWAKEVYLAYDRKHARKVDKLAFRQLGVGLLEVSDSYTVRLEWKPTRNPADPKILLSFFTTKYLRKIARLHKISTTGSKNEIAKSLSYTLDKRKINELLVSYLKSRAKVSREKATNEYGQTLQTCP